MRRLGLAVGVVAAVMAALAIAPALAAATVESSSITTWTSSEAGTPANGSYLVSYDNPGQSTSLTVQGTAPGAADADRLDIVCYYGSGANFGDAVLASNVAVTSGAFSTTAPLRSIAGHACRLRAIPKGGESSSDDSRFAGPQVAVSQAGLPSGTIDGLPDDFYVIGTTFTGYAGWGSAGSCGPYAAPFDSSFGQGNFAIDCMGSLLGSANLSVGNRSEVQVDGQNAYDAASAQAIFNGTESVTNFPALSAHAIADPTDGLVSSQSTEGWVVCPGLSASAYPPTSGNCPTFASAGVQLQRDITTSDGGLVVTLTDTWSSIDGNAHTLDLLYDDYVGLKSTDTERGYEFPGQATFSAYGQGTTLPAPNDGPGSILVRTNLAAPDGATSEADGAITFSTAPSGFTFVSGSEFEEHQVLQVPAGGTASLSYVYSTGYTLGQVDALALAAQDRFQAPAIAITSPADGATLSTPYAEVTGTAGAGSGIASVSIAGQSVPVSQAGTWAARVPLSPGSNTITALATDGAGATVQSQVTVAYQPPPPSLSASGLGPVPIAPPVTVCKVPRIKGMKLPAAERALRKAHCRAGKIKHERSKKVRKGRIVSTGPPAGRKLPAGSKVELFLSKGR